MKHIINCNNGDEIHVEKLPYGRGFTIKHYQYVKSGDYLCYDGSINLPDDLAALEKLIEVFRLK